MADAVIQDAADIAAALVEHGQAMTLRRQLTSSPQTWQDVTVYGKAYGFRGDLLVGDIQQGVRRVRISNTEIAAASWPGPPAKGDRLVMEGKTFAVNECDTRKYGATILMHILTVKG